MPRFRRHEVRALLGRRVCLLSVVLLSPCYVLSLPCTNSRALCSKGTAAAEAQAELLASENDEERYEHAEKLL